MRSLPWRRAPQRVTLFNRGPRACAGCHWVARWLVQRNVQVTELDIAASAAARERLRRLTNAELPVPTLLLSDGEVVVWPGPSTLEALFGGAARQRA
jgi:glutaredoxin